MGKRYTTMQRVNAVNAWAKNGGGSVEVFAEAYGIPATTLHSWIRDPEINHTGLMPKGSVITDERKDKIIKLRKEFKMTYPDIANAVGVSERSVARIIQAHPELDFVHVGGKNAKKIDLVAENAKNKKEEVHVIKNEVIAANSDTTPVEPKNVLKLSVIQVKGAVTGFRYNMGDRLMINNNFVVEYDQLKDFLDEIDQCLKLVEAVRN